MIKKCSLLCFSMLLIFMLSGCTTSIPTTASPQPTSTSTPLNSLTAKETVSTETVSTAPTFDIEGLHNGDVIAQDQLNLQVILHNFTLMDRNTEHKPVANQGHIHYWLDSNPTDPGAAVQVDKDPEHILLSNLKAGQHILTIKLVGMDHQPTTETTTQIITFLVKRKDAASTNADTATPKSNETTAPTQASTTPQQTTKSTANEVDEKTATFAIVGLKNGDIISTEDLKFAIDVQNLSLVNYSIHPDAKAGEGHIHIWLDTTSTESKAAMKQYNDPKHIVIKDIAEGEHTIIIGLVSNDHQTIIGDRQAITFSVKRK
jgi:hypothetical protein